MKIYQFLTLAGAFLLWLPHSALAQTQTQPADTTKAYQLGEIIVTANRIEETPISVGRNVTVISQNEIQNAMPYSVGDLLANQQSIHLVGNGQTPGSIQSAFLRNTNSDNSLVLIDGMRISDPSSTENTANLAEISLANVQRIEIVRGAHSTLYGSSAIGGVINIITKDKSSPGLNGRFETRHGLFSRDIYSTTNRGFLNYTLPNGFYMNASALWKDTGGMDATQDTLSNPHVFRTADNDGFDKLDLAAKAGFKDEAWDAFISYRRADQTVELDQGAFEDDDNAFSEFQRDLLNYRAVRKLSDRLELTLSGGYSDLQRDFVNDSSVVDASGNFDGTIAETHAVASMLENELTGQYHTENFTGTAGIGATRQTMNVETYTLVRSFNFESSSDLDSLNLKENITYGFLHTELKGGLINKSLDLFSLGLGGRLLSHNQFGTQITYEINPKYQIFPGALVYGAMTTGFNAPSLYQLNTPEQAFGAYTDRGNEELDPETSVSYELGWKQQVGERLRFNIALFKTEVQNIIEYVYLWDSDTPLSELSSQDYLGDTYLNASQQHIKGIEAGLDAQLTADLSFHGNISLTDSKISFAEEDIDEEQTGGNYVQIYESGAFVSNGEELDNLTRRPDFSGTFRLNYRPVERLAMEVSTRFVGSRNDVAYSSALGPYGALNFNEVSSYNVTDFGVRYDVSDWLGLHFKVENIFDEDYVEINGYRTKGRGFFLKGAFSF